MTKYDTSSLRIRVDFSKEGSGRFERTRVGRDLNAFRLCHDLAEYIERHIDAGRDMTEMFTVRYEGGIFLTVYLCSGVFYITDVTDVGTIIAAKAVMVWKQVKRGIEILTVRVLVGWQLLRACC